MAGSTASAKAPPSLKKSTSNSQSGKNQSSIASFFQKKSAPVAATATLKMEEPYLPANGIAKSTAFKKSPKGSSQSLTPAPSSDAPEYADEKESTPTIAKEKSTVNGLPSPVTPAEVTIKDEQKNGHEPSKGFYSPSRKAGLPFFLCGIHWLTDCVIG